MQKLVYGLIVALIAAAPLLAADKEEGYTKLFNGKDLTGWQGAVKGYVAEDGALVCDPKKGGGKLFTAKEYGNFSFRFEFQLTPGANNGVGIRTPLQGDPAYAGMEIQVLDNTHKKYANLKPYQYHGSIYGVAAAKRGHLKPTGEWNVQEILCDGTKIKVTLNGVVIVEKDIAEAIKNGTLDKRNHPGLKNTKGYIGFLGHGSRVAFRNIRIKELK